MADNVRLYMLAGTFALLVLSLIWLLAALVRTLRTTGREAYDVPSPESGYSLHSSEAIDTDLAGLDISPTPGSLQAALLEPLRAGEWHPREVPATPAELEAASLSHRIAEWAPGVPELKSGPAQPVSESLLVGIPEPGERRSAEVVEDSAQTATISEVVVPSVELAPASADTEHQSVPASVGVPEADATVPAPPLVYGYPATQQPCVVPVPMWSVPMQQWQSGQWPAAQSPYGTYGWQAPVSPPPWQATPPTMPWAQPQTHHWQQPAYPQAPPEIQVPLLGETGRVPAPPPQLVQPTLDEDVSLRPQATVGVPPIPDTTAAPPLSDARAASDLTALDAALASVSMVTEGFPSDEISALVDAQVAVPSLPEVEPTRPLDEDMPVERAVPAAEPLPSDAGHLGVSGFVDIRAFEDVVPSSTTGLVIDFEALLPPVTFESIPEVELPISSVPAAETPVVIEDVTPAPTPVALPYEEELVAFAEPAVPDEAAAVLVPRTRAPRVRPAVVPEVDMVAPVEMWFGDSRVGVRPGTRTYDQFRKYADNLLNDLHRTSTPRTRVGR